MAKKENKNEIIWLLCNKKELEAEVHQMAFNDTEEGKELYWENIQYLTDLYTKKNYIVKAEFKNGNQCILTIWT